MKYGVCKFAVISLPCVIRHSSQPISQGVTLLFFFTEKKKRSKKRKEFAFHLYCKIQVPHEDDTKNVGIL